MGHGVLLGSPTTTPTLAAQWATPQELAGGWMDGMLEQMKILANCITKTVALALPPNPGQLVKIITYDNNVSKEFLGPYTIDQLTVTEEYRNVIRNLQKGLDISAVLPKKTKTFLSGYNSEQFMMGDNEFIMRLAHINTDKTRKNTYPFFQLSQFNNSYNVVNQTVNTVSIVDPAINYIAELFIDYSPKIATASEQNIVGTLIVYDASTITNTQNKIGLTKATYEPSKSYIDKYTNSFIVKHVINTSNITDFQIIVNNIIETYNSNSKIAYFTATGDTTQTINDTVKNQTIVITNNLTISPTAGGGTHDDPTVVTGGLNNWLFRLTPGTSVKNYIGTFTKPNITDPNNIVLINYNNYVGLDSFITNNNTETDYGQLVSNNETIIVSNQDVAQQTGIPQSVQTIYSDKFLFLSSITSPSLVDDTSFDGFSSSKVAEILYGTNQDVITYGFLRGEPMMDLLNDILNMLLTHGHQVGVDPASSIVETSKQQIMDLIKRIQDEKNQNQNNVVINHNLRLN